VAADVSDLLPAYGRKRDVFDLHRGGKIGVVATSPLRDNADLSLAYTPGVAEVCLAIAARPDLARRYTWTGSTVAIVTDGSAVLGLGQIGPTAAMPVMEGKALLFKRFADVNAVPLCLATTDVDEIVETVVRLAPSFGGINLEDISAPRCFDIERGLQDRLDIPVFHDDQHGTAIVVLAALRNAVRLTGRTLADVRVAISGAGAAGIAVAWMLLRAGVGDITLTDRSGIVAAGRGDLNPHKAELASATNPRNLTGGIDVALRGADVFVGLSGGRVAESTVASMAAEPVVFALANPDPEVPIEIGRRHASVMATGRSDYPNQINNALAFPGVFAGALRAGARVISDGMKLAAADALAGLVQEVSATAIIPSVFDPRVGPVVAHAVMEAALADGVAQLTP
jgi:malate dehydrogenase (oxaloacetate-decarboxylating)